ncbi:MAG TPA: hypothetical protein VE954_23110, partial [Oligoflexus sp.]|nr:hypothetical protein [Oligoflexus sp.]
GVEVDHSTVHRWINRYTPELEAEFRKRKKPVSGRWFWDEMALKVKGNGFTGPWTRMAIR